MVFHPSMDQFAPDGFCPLVEGIVEQIFKFASLSPRWLLTSRLSRTTSSTWKRYARGRG